MEKKKEKQKIAFILFGLFIFGIIIGVSQSKEKILANRQAQEDRKIAAQQRAEAEKQAQEEKKKAKEEAKNKPETGPEGVPNISERPVDACSVQPSDKFWVPKAQVGELGLEVGTHVVTKEEEGAYSVPAGDIQIVMNWYCPESQPSKLTISGDDKKAREFYVLEGETINVLSPYIYLISHSVTFPELGRVTYAPGTLVTDYTFPGRRYE